MAEKIFLCWTGWGMLFTTIVSLCIFGHIAATVKLGSGTPFRNILGFVNLLAIIAIFVTSGWIAGIISIPIGIVLGVCLARILMPPRL